MGPESWGFELKSKSTSQLAAATTAGSITSDSAHAWQCGEEFIIHGEDIHPRKGHPTISMVTEMEAQET